MNIALVAPHTLHVKLFWTDLISRLQDDGHHVFVYAAEDECAAELRALGAQVRPTPLYRFLNPWKDLTLVYFLIKAFQNDSIDIVSNFTVKPNVFGALAAFLSGRKSVVSMVLGLGTVFSSQGFKAGVLRMLLCVLYRIGFLCAKRVCFVNSDDLKLALGKGLLPSSKALLIPSAIGVNLTRFSPQLVSEEAKASIRKECKLRPGDILVLMMGRMLWGKGVREFCEAAELLSSSHPHVHFVLVGGADTGSPDAVPDTYLQEQQGKGLCYLGFRKDVIPLLATADIFVLPSFYGEGLPQVLLEAMAMEKPIISTDNVGCRDAVDHGKNGFLIPTRSSTALAEAVARLSEDSQLRAQFAKASLLKAEREFEKNMILGRLLNEWYALPEQTAADPEKLAQQG